MARHHNGRRLNVLSAIALFLNYAQIAILIGFNVHDAIIIITVAAQHLRWTLRAPLFEKAIIMRIQSAPLFEKAIARRITVAIFDIARKLISLF